MRTHDVDDDGDVVRNVDHVCLVPRKKVSGKI